ncbi:hypothetical protein C5C37_02110 [Rathayibacter sp. AY1F9]|nr:hypothetical protein C5C37_02110 [Rathayibacter sp. AY1F9]
MPSVKARTLAVTIGAIVLIGAGATFVVDPFQWRSGPGSSASAPVSSATPTQSPDVTDPTAEAVADALRAVPEDPVAGASEALRPAVQAAPDVAVPPGATIDVDSSTWVATDDQAGTIAMSMTVPGEADPRAYLAFMVVENGVWKLDGTIESELQQ